MPVYWDAKANREKPAAVKKDAPLLKAVDEMTVPEIKALLTKRKVEFKSSLSKADLLGILSEDIAGEVKD